MVLTFLHATSKAAVFYYVPVLMLAIAIGESYN